MLTANGKERILMDFNLHKGDVSEEGGRLITDEDFIEIRGEKRRRLKVEEYNWYWVEGIGYNYDYALMPDFVIAYGESSYVVDCYDKGRLLFTFDDFYSPACAINNLYISRDNNDNNIYDITGKKNIFPNKGIIIKNGRKILLNK